MIPLHKIVSIDDASNFRMKINTLSGDFMFQAKNNLERDNWKKTIEQNLQAEYLETRYFIIIGPLINQEDGKCFYILNGDQLITAKETIINSLLSKYK